MKRNNRKFRLSGKCSRNIQRLQAQSNQSQSPCRPGFTPAEVNELTDALIRASGSAKFTDAQYAELAQNLAVLHGAAVTLEMLMAGLFRPVFRSGDIHFEPVGPAQRTGAKPRATLPTTAATASVVPTEQDETQADEEAQGEAPLGNNSNLRVQDFFSFEQELLLLDALSRSSADGTFTEDHYVQLMTWACEVKQSENSLRLIKAGLVKLVLKDGHIQVQPAGLPEQN